jgi:hypothetical protein
MITTNAFHHCKTAVGRAAMGLLLGRGPVLQAVGTPDWVSSPMPATESLYLSTNVVWDAKSKATNVAAGLDHADFAFCFTNHTAAALTVTGVHTSCGCTTAQLPALPWKIPPQSGGQIGVRVNLAGKSGEVVKTVTIETDQGAKTPQVKATIMPPPASAISTGGS